MFGKGRGPPGFLGLLGVSTLLGIPHWQHPCYYQSFAMKSRLDQIEDWGLIACKGRFEVQSMAALCRVEPRTLQRFFQRRFQQPPKDWAIDLRLEIARALIKQGWVHKEVAELLGYASVSVRKSHF